MPGGAEEQEYADPIELQTTAAITPGGTEEQYEVPAVRSSAVYDGEIHVEEGLRNSNQVSRSLPNEL